MVARGPSGATPQAISYGGGVGPPGGLYCFILLILSLERGSLTTSTHCQTHSRCLISNCQIDEALKVHFSKIPMNRGSVYKRVDLVPNLLENRNVQASGKKNVSLPLGGLGIFSGHSRFLKVSLAGSAVCGFRSPCAEWPFHLDQ